MKKTVNCVLWAGLLIGLTGAGVNAQVPSNFPTLVISSNGPVAPGDFIGSLGAKGSATNTYNVALDNGGNPLSWLRFTNVWRTVTPCGLIPESGTSWLLRDESFTVVNTYPGGDGHDFKLLPNGDALILNNENWPVDMSLYVPGGRPDAVLSSLVFTEVDATKQVVFQWRARDHLAITDSLDFNTLASVDWTHVNAIAMDPLDNNYLISLRGFCQIIKVSRTTGDVIWRLGGKSGNFTFINEHPENAPYYFIGQHNVHRLANGDIIFFDNGSLQNQGPLPGRTYSRAVEYALDEVHMTATLVWEYRHTPDLLNPTEGIVERFSNGNTLIGWVSAAAQGTAPILTEVNAAGQVMFEMSAPGFKSQSMLTKKVWNSPDLVHSSTNNGIVAGQVYSAPTAGVSVLVNSLSGAGTQLVISGHDDAVRLPQFSGKPPQVLVPRVTLSGIGIDAITAAVTFTLPANSFSFDTPLYSDPTQLTIFQRATPGQGVFLPLPTVYDPVAQTLTASTTNLGEFIFTYPDLPELPLAPILSGQAIQPTVDQAEPVIFQWTPRGFAHGYHLQVATDAAFGNLVVDQPGLTNMTYTLATVQPGTNYYWRVNVTNTGGTSDWTTASFLAAPALIQVTSPAGGEAWQRGLSSFIRWTNNISENVAIYLYKGSTLISKLTTNTPNIGAYSWAISITNVPGSTYSIKILSATNATVFGTSALPFSIVDAPAFTPGSLSQLPDGRVQFGLTAAGPPTATVMGSTNLTTWTVVQQVPLTNGAAVFTDNASTNFPARFYQLRVP